MPENAGRLWRHQGVSCTDCERPSFLMSNPPYSYDHMVVSHARGLPEVCINYVWWARGRPRSRGTQVKQPAAAAAALFGRLTTQASRRAAKVLFTFGAAPCHTPISARPSPFFYWWQDNQDQRLTWSRLYFQKGLFLDRAGRCPWMVLKTACLMPCLMYRGIANIY